MGQGKLGLGLLGIEFVGLGEWRFLIGHARDRAATRPLTKLRAVPSTGRAGLGPSQKKGGSAVPSRSMLHADLYC